MKRTISIECERCEKWIDVSEKEHTAHSGPWYCESCYKEISRADQKESLRRSMNSNCY